eukprot:CAMPEP_0119332014 /NCGR_PEP_ID=MMETSP1333-20130426/81851_1 /TAXON_ID=418940 /ORGANISM="Scyphosphaera apsteinii, Strain RCC1455" /LENGTH=369 /DNA_ID=CAMNT_0007341751 /DNA_START=96 /DNA_END=1205 /DNA_ORIENTATION=+
MRRTLVNDVVDTPVLFELGDTARLREFEASVQKIEMGSFSRTLRREDRWLKTEETIGEDQVFFGVVADGHGGSEASEHAVARVVQYICSEAAGDATSASLKWAGQRAFARLHEEVCASGTTAGTTLTVCAVNPHRRELTTMNVGDSIALLYPRPLKSLPTTAAASQPQQLTADHRLQTNTKEQLRCKLQGAMIARAVDPTTGGPGGPLRVWPGGVAQVRTIGDADVGRIISPLPASSTIILPDTGSWDCIICSDGVSDALAYPTLFKLCRRSKLASASTTAKLVVDEAVAKRHAFNNEGFQVPRDDTTCVILRFLDPRDTDASAGCALETCEDVGPLPHVDVGKDHVHDAFDSSHFRAVGPEGAGQDRL